MSADNTKDRKQTTTDKEKVSFLDRLIHGKGTVAEPWPTVEEVLKKEEVQNEIKKVHKAFNAYQAKKNKN